MSNSPLQPGRLAGATDNLLLASLGPESWARLEPHLKTVDLPRGHLLQSPDVPIESVYFMETGMLSIVLTSRDGTGIEVGMIGQEGLLGSAVVLGDSHSRSQVMVQIAGKARQLPVLEFQQEFRRGSRMHEMVLAHFQLQLTDASQSALCNRLHSVQQRLCRWLLTVRDRTQSDDLSLTQEFITDMLGTRRPGVTVVAGELQAAGMISYRRGQITIRDAEAMEERACECYGIIRDQYERLVQRSFRARQRDF